MNRSKLKIIWEKTNGHCHFCGKKLIFKAYGPRSGKRGKWQVDHIFPKAKGGINSVENYLPICRACNRPRWMWTGHKIQKLFRYGIIAYREARRKNEIGKAIRRLYLLKRMANLYRKNKKRKWK